MASAKQCDRCKEYYKFNYYKSDILMNYKDKDIDKIKNIAIITDKGNSKYYDLCDECLKLLDYFLSNKEVKFKGVI